MYRAGALAREAALSAFAAASVAALLAWYGPPGSDFAAHAYQRAVFLQHGFSLWSNFWYAGRYSFVTYSLLYYRSPACSGSVFWRWRRSRPQRSPSPSCSGANGARPRAGRAAPSRSSGRGSCSRPPSRRAAGSRSALLLCGAAGAAALALRAAVALTLAAVSPSFCLLPSRVALGRRVSAGYGFAARAGPPRSRPGARGLLRRTLSRRRWSRWRPTIRRRSAASPGGSSRRGCCARSSSTWPPAVVDLVPSVNGREHRAAALRRYLVAGAALAAAAARVVAVVSLGPAIAWTITLLAASHAKGSADPAATPATGHCARSRPHVVPRRGRRHDGHLGAVTRRRQGSARGLVSSRTTFRERTPVQRLGPRAYTRGRARSARATPLRGARAVDDRRAARRRSRRWRALCGWCSRTCSDGVRARGGDRS